jgi:hypothetical protein
MESLQCPFIEIKITAGDPTMLKVMGININGLEGIGADRKILQISIVLRRRVVMGGSSENRRFQYRSRHQPCPVDLQEPQRDWPRWLCFIVIPSLALGAGCRMVGPASCYSHSFFVESQDIIETHLPTRRTENDDGRGERC